MVAMLLDAEKGGRELADRFDVSSFPTVVFLDSRGNEVDRILGFLPPDQFLAQLRRIRSGDTFNACLARLSDDPTDRQALQRAVEGLLERADPEGAIERIETYLSSVGDVSRAESCSYLMLRSRSLLLERLYERAGKLFRNGWDQKLEVPDTAGVRALRGLIAAGLGDLGADEQASRLREARRSDGASLLQGVVLDDLDVQELFEVAGFAMANGSYEVGAGAYLEWADRAGSTADPSRLNQAAWDLYLAGQQLDRAVELARQAYAADPSSSIADTLGRLLYATGASEEAIEVQAMAVSASDSKQGGEYAEVLERMKEGGQLADRPWFESYPGQRQG